MVRIQWRTPCKIMMSELAHALYLQLLQNGVHPPVYPLMVKSQIGQYSSST